MSGLKKLGKLALIALILCASFACGDDCEVSDEVANLLDDDCDGEIDNGFKYVFLTSSKHTGDLTASSPIVTMDGLDAGDAICDELAADADLPGSYVAWLSSATVAAADSIPLDPDNDDTYILVDGTVIAEGFDDVLDGAIDNPIQRDELGTLIPADGNDSFVWTGSFASGMPQSDPVQFCNDWTDGTTDLGA